MKTFVTLDNPQLTKHKAQLEAFGDAIGAECIHYQDLGNGEKYTIKINGKVATINVGGNKYDGGFANFEVEEG
jgi:hypothetical protein